MIHPSRLERTCQNVTSPDRAMSIYKKFLGGNVSQMLLL